MNAGLDFEEALALAQANANRRGEPWRLGSYGTVWWVDALPTWQHDAHAWATEQVERGAFIVWPTKRGFKVQWGGGIVLSSTTAGVKSDLFVPQVRHRR